MTRAEWRWLLVASALVLFKGSMSVFSSPPLTKKYGDSVFPSIFS